MEGCLKYIQFVNSSVYFLNLPRWIKDSIPRLHQHTSYTNGDFRWIAPYKTPLPLSRVIVKNNTIAIIINLSLYPLLECCQIWCSLYRTVHFTIIVRKDSASLTSKKIGLPLNSMYIFILWALKFALTNNLSLFC